MLLNNIGFEVLLVTDLWALEDNFERTNLPHKRMWNKIMMLKYRLMNSVSKKLQKKKDIVYVIKFFKKIHKRFSN